MELPTIIAIWFILIWFMQTLATHQNYYRTCYITKISSCSEDIIRCNIKYYKIIADVIRKRLLLKLIKQKERILFDDFIQTFICLMLMIFSIAIVRVIFNYLSTKKRMICNFPSKIGLIYKIQCTIENI